MGRPCGCCDGPCSCDATHGYCGSEFRVCVPESIDRGDCHWCEADPDDPLTQCPEGAMDGCRIGGFNVTLSGDARWEFVRRAQRVTFDVDSSRVRFRDYAPHAGEWFRFSILSGDTGTLPTGLSSTSDYYVENIDGDTAQIRTLSGSVITFANAGSGRIHAILHGSSTGGRCQLRLNGTSGAAVLLIPLTAADTRFPEIPPLSDGVEWRDIATYGCRYTAGFQFRVGASIKVWAGYRNGPGVVYESGHPASRAVLDANGQISSSEACAFPTPPIETISSALRGINLGANAMPTVQQGCLVELWAGSGNISWLPPSNQRAVSWMEPFSPSGMDYAVYGAEITSVRPIYLQTRDNIIPLCNFNESRQSLCGRYTTPLSPYAGGNFDIVQRVLPDAIQIAGLDVQATPELTEWIEGWAEGSGSIVLPETGSKLLYYGDYLLTLDDQASPDGFGVIGPRVSYHVYGAESGGLDWTTGNVLLPGEQVREVLTIGPLASGWNGITISYSLSQEEGSGWDGAWDAGAISASAFYSFGDISNGHGICPSRTLSLTSQTHSAPSAIFPDGVVTFPASITISEA